MSIKLKKFAKNYKQKCEMAINIKEKNYNGLGTE